MEDEGGDLEGKGGKCWEIKPSQGEWDGRGCAGKRIISLLEVTKDNQSFKAIARLGALGCQLSI